MEGWTDLFHRILLATARGPTSRTAVDWHLKVKDMDDNVSLTKKSTASQSAWKKTAPFINSFFR